MPPNTPPAARLNLVIPGIQQMRQGNTENFGNFPRLWADLKRAVDQGHHRRNLKPGNGLMLRKTAQYAGQFPWQADFFPRLSQSGIRDGCIRRILFATGKGDLSGMMLQR
jgi:hypothetical protein